MKIDIEELMVGDWVMIHEYPMIKEPRKVTKEHFVRSLCEFEAIPITEEFLLNNGFEFFSAKDVFLLFLRTEQCLLAYMNGHKALKIYKGKVGDDIYPISCEQVPIEYVHELQHILKLGKIDIDVKID